MQDLAVYILAGGKSTRMGQDKSLLPFHGHTLLEEVIQVATQLSRDVFLLSQNPIHKQFGIPMIKDIIPHQGPAGGIDAMLQQTPFTYNVILNCDMPFVDVQGLQLLVEAIPSHSIALFKHTATHLVFPLVIHQDCREPWRQLLLADVRKLSDIISQFDSIFVDASSVMLRNSLFFKNINTPDDYQSITT